MLAPDLHALEGHADTVQAAFRPVADLRCGDVVSYEALLALPDEVPRSPAGWSDGGRARHAGALEAWLLRRALATGSKLPPRSSLVVTLSAAAAVTAPVREALMAHAPLQRLVVSLEHAAGVEPYALGAALEPARGQGARIAVGAAGAGCEDLERLARLRPELVRADAELVDGLAGDVAREAALRAAVQLARGIDAEVLGTGVAAEADLRALAAAGAALAAGPLVGRPTARMEPLDAALEALVAAIAVDAPPEPTVAPLIESPIALSVRTPLPDIVDTLLLDPRRDFLALVDDEQRPVALVERAAVLRGEPFELPVLWVLPDSPLRAVARRAVERPPLERYAPLVCCDTGGRYIGLVRMERLVAALAR